MRLLRGGHVKARDGFVEIYRNFSVVIFPQWASFADYVLSVGPEDWACEEFVLGIVPQCSMWEN
ncbi:hypothetical protein Fuma_01522 [Fuerstiella marisgermanici]|uniref:Uncharacterized protein n=1 Tax=Fuerstiella marisgermanici TaxID=1891926 RepID=A0A1P8WD01_9PLAN|nr:hypothetical protein Fuma_01522 [Fuerstiella marisgermanici]